MLNTLITGATGFTGKHLHEYLNYSESEKLFHTSLSHNEVYENFTSCDLLDSDKVRSFIDEVAPDNIYHLAGSFTNNFDIDYSTNVQTTKNILEAVKLKKKPCRVFLVGSAAEYGYTKVNENPVTENQKLKPASFYGLTKVFQTYLMKYYVDTFGMDIVMARPFNLYGKDISDKLFVGKVYEQIDQLKKNIINKIKVGNIDGERDYIYIKDAVKHYVTIMRAGKSGEVYNVGNGVPVKTELILKNILEEENIDWSLVEINKTKKDRIYDAPVIYAEIIRLINLGQAL